LCVEKGVEAGDSNRASQERSQEADSFHTLLLLDSTQKVLFHNWVLNKKECSLVLVLGGAEDRIVARNSVLELNQDHLCSCRGSAGSDTAVDFSVVQAMGL
jgi:hypothetical protein